MGLTAAPRLEVRSEYVCDASCLFTRPDDSSQLCYVQESASFCLCSKRKKKTKAGGGEERCSLSIVIKHDRMQFQSAATFPVESWRCLDRTMLLFCSVAINTFADVFVLYIFSAQSWTERAKGLTADAADLKKRKRAEGGTVGAMENETELTDESSAKKKKSLDSGSSKLSAFAYAKN